MNLIRKSKKPLTPKLHRVNAIKNFHYVPSPDSSSPSPEPSHHARSLDLTTPSTTSSSNSDLSSVTSFRIHGSGKDEIESLCRSLGLTSSDDFGISPEAWEAAHLSKSLPLAVCSGGGKDDEPESEPRVLMSGELGFREGLDTGCEDPPNGLNCDEPIVNINVSRGINGVRPPQLTTLRLRNSFGIKGEIGGDNCGSPTTILPLAPPPCMSLPKYDQKGTDSVWDIVSSFGPEGMKDEHEHEQHNNGFYADRKASRIQPLDADEEDDEDLDIDGFRSGETTEGFTGTSSLATTVDDETSSTTTEVMFVVSPNGRFKKKITKWMRGIMLGHGSFGVVYEGISDEGGFFAVKEVSLLGQGSNAQQCITQLEQEIALLSQFEHENIVQYYGTDKEESKLYIFLELVTQGSLSSLYEKYRLRDSQVSAYTRQILRGLEYLHERNIVHRDIKCANILVHADGSVKLADFGLAKEITKMNNLKSCKGSAYWMAPEVVNPRSTYGRAADIWSLGCTVLEMLTRQVPYPHLEWTQALFQIGQGVPPPIPAYLSKDARNFISQCVRVDPSDRPSASELLNHPFVRGSIQSSKLLDSPCLADRWNRLYS